MRTKVRIYHYWHKINCNPSIAYHDNIPKFGGCNSGIMSRLMLLSGNSYSPRLLGSCDEG